MFRQAIFLFALCLSNEACIYFRYSLNNETEVPYSSLYLTLQFVDLAWTLVFLSMPLGVSGERTSERSLTF